jgi:mannosyl-oligosaccharide alpha-1,2-mannosidase
MIGLGAQTLKNDLSERYMGIAEAITNTCHESYDRTATKLGPEAFRFTEAIEAKALKSSEKYYILRPEVIESYFIMWRLTKQQKYRDWGWEAVQVKYILYRAVLKRKNCMNTGLQQNHINPCS